MFPRRNTFWLQFLFLQHCCFLTQINLFGWRLIRHVWELCYMDWVLPAVHHILFTWRHRTVTNIMRKAAAMTYQCWKGHEVLFHHYSWSWCQLFLKEYDQNQKKCFVVAYSCDKILFQESNKKSQLFQKLSVGAWWHLCSCKIFHRQMSFFHVHKLKVYKCLLSSGGWFIRDDKSWHYLDSIESMAKMESSEMMALEVDDVFVDWWLVIIFMSLSWQKASNRTKM